MRILKQDKCRICRTGFGQTPLQLGRLPVCNKFNDDPTSHKFYRLSIICCEKCGLVQLYEYPNMDSIIPEVPWIQYNEPHDHLDELANQIWNNRINEKPKVIGIGPFEKPLLDRLEYRGAEVSSVPLLSQLRTSNQHPYLETWQRLISHNKIPTIADDMRKADMITCRYLIEHCENPIEALKALGELINSDGVLLIEVPDSSKFLMRKDFSFIWEEHQSYFVRETIEALALKAGFYFRDFYRFPGDLEDSLVCILGRGQRPNSIQPDCSKFNRMRKTFERQCLTVYENIQKMSGGDRNKIALFGIGHQAILFSNIYGITSLIGYISDDNANKIGLYPPGFNSRIISSAELQVHEEVEVCLLAVAPEVFGRVQQKLEKFKRRGVQFYSIFSGVEASIFRDFRNENDAIEA